MTVHRFTQAPMHASCYVILSDECDSGIIIDPCVSPKVIFSKLGHSIRITHILITHGHFDHIFMTDELISATGAELIVSADDSIMLTSPLMNASALMGVMPDVVCASKPDTLLYGGEEISAGDLTVKVFPAPGHTFGGMLYLIDNCLFSGDTLFFGSYGRYDLYGGDRDSLEETLISMRGFLNKGIRLFPGHGGECDFDKAYTTIQ